MGSGVLLLGDRTDIARLQRMQGSGVWCPNLCPARSAVGGRWGYVRTYSCSVELWRCWERRSSLTRWPQVCSDGFDDVEATVVCNELGLTSAGPGAWA